jgi:PEP-CTERM motif-containing protein
VKKLFALMAVSVIALVGFTSNAGAVLSFDLGLGNAAMAGFPGPYAQVSVTRTSATTADIVFTAYAQGGYQYLLGDGGSVAVNVNAASWALGPISGINTGVGYSPGPYSDAGAGAEDGFGSFNQTINSFDGNSHSATQIAFSLTNTSGTWASDADVLTGNGSGFRAAAHIFVTSFPANASNGAIATGFATEGGGGSVPEPTSMLLLGLGLAGFGAARRRKKN